MTTKTYIDPSDVAGVIRANSVAGDKAALAKLVFNTLVNAAGQTLTAAQLLGGILARSGAVTVSDTTPTAALLVAAYAGVAVGDVVLFRLRNGNTGVLTLLAGTSVTLEGTTTVTNALCREYAIRFTNVTVGAEAVTLSGMQAAAI
jgi:hypothetical protein